MSDKDNMKFRYWKGGAYKEAFILVFYKFLGLLIVPIFFILLPLIILEEEYMMIVGMIIYALVGYLLSVRTYGELQFFSDRMMMTLGSYSMNVQPEDISELQYYVSKSVRNVPRYYRGVSVKASYDANYTLSFKIKKKRYYMYDVYPNISEDGIPDNMQLHVLYKKLKKYVTVQSQAD